MSVAVTTTVEMLAMEPMSARAYPMFQALEQAAGSQGIDVCRTSAYYGSDEWLVIWGYGGRADIINRHVANGGRAIVLDLAYWQRDTKVRVSIDAPHPDAWVMQRDWPMDRFELDRVPVSQSWNPNGPVVIAGLGAKASRHYGPDVVAMWEANRADECRRRWPHRAVIYRAKTSAHPVPSWASSVSSGTPIEQLLKGASLLVTWHSNVAVDAIRMGIPVACMAGAAAAVCPSEIPAQPAPLPTDIRDRFLSNLAWFQWAPSEAAACWRWLQEMLS